MAKAFSNGKSQKYHLNVNEDLLIFLTSKLSTCFIDEFTLEIISQSSAYLPSGSGHLYWILDLEGEVHSIWVLWTSGLQETFQKFCGGCGPHPLSQQRPFALKVRWGVDVRIRLSVWMRHLCFNSLPWLSQLVRVVLISKTCTILPSLKLVIIGIFIEWYQIYEYTIIYHAF